jgi:murein DD-endopeptidase MepM/ murein hydrolase activator NlpD
MKIILIDRKHEASRAVTLGSRSLAFLSLFLLGIPVGFASLGYHWSQSSWQPGPDTVSLDFLQDEVDDQAQAVLELRAQAERRLQSLSMTMAEMEARLLRLDAMGQRLTELSGLDEGEFDFSRSPALGGPLTNASGDSERVVSNDLATEMGALGTSIADREQQLELLDALLVNRQLQDDIYLSGRPIGKGWMSSAFGRRKDPFTGQSSWHQGVDFAGKAGSDIVAVAGGVVTWSGERYGYGEMVEISHGGGYSTRYAHNEKNLVKVGDIVGKGQVLALMGSSGRSTGPHVHYEVYKHGRPVDPASYVRRTHR